VAWKWSDFSTATHCFASRLDGLRHWSYTRCQPLGGPRSALIRVITVLVCSAVVLTAQDPVRAVRARLYVNAIQSKGGDISLRDALIDGLKKEKSIVIVSSVAQAELVLDGFGETFIKGYLGRNHRVRYRNSDSQPIYGGYLSVELKDKNDDTVWSNLVTPSRFGSGDIGKDLAGQVVSRLAEFLASSKGVTATP
jgi:hypothetical protein